MKSPTLVEKPPFVPQSPEVSEQVSGFFGDTEVPESEENFDDPWQHLTSRHPELANLRQSPWATWGARKRRGSAAGHERPSTDSSNDSRSRLFRDSFYDTLPPEFREHIPTRWNPHFEEDDNQRYPQASRQENVHQENAPQERPAQSSIDRATQSSTDKATQTLKDETDDSSAKQNQTPNLPQYGLRNTVDLGQKTAAEPGQLDAEAARNQRSMSAPPDGRFSSPQRPVQANNNSVNANTQTMGTAQHQQTDQNNKQPAVRVIPIFVEGRDEPVINNKADAAPPNYTESRPTPPKDDDFFANHEIPHGFPQQSQFGRSFGTPFKNFGNRPTTGSVFGPSKVFQQQTRQPPQQQQQYEQNQQPKTFKPQTQAPNQNANEHMEVPVNEPQQQPGEQQREQSPQPAPSQQPQINDAISKIQSIQKDVLELMSQVEIFSGKTKKDKEYIYLDEMLTRNLLKLDDIETEGKENIRLARREAIKCIQKCIAVLEAKAENAATNDNNHDASKENQSPPTGDEKPEKMDTADESQKLTKSVGKKKRDKSKDKNGVQRMDVEKIGEQCDNKGAVSETTDAQIVDKCTNNANGTAMEVDSVAPSQ